jgi:hypothetical protein
METMETALFIKDNLLKTKWKQGGNNGNKTECRGVCFQCFQFVSSIKTVKYTIKTKAFPLFPVFPPKKAMLL